MRTSRPSSRDAVERRERGADGALGVVLVLERHAEGGHHGVARELLHRPAVGDDAVRDLVEEAADAAAHDLRIDVRRADRSSATRSTKSTVASFRSTMLAIVVSGGRPG